MQIWHSALLVAVFPVLVGGAPAPLSAQNVQYNRDVRPILADKCYQCHGPDAEARQAELRFDQREAFQQERDSGRIVVPGQPGDSLLWQRVGSSDPDHRMPPRDARKQLTQREIQTLKSWIEQGANWDRHWSFVRPQPVQPPRTASSAIAANAIDQFVLRRLAEREWTFSPPASDEVLIRRVTQDLTGLPPTIAEVDAFLRDRRPDRYERVVDRLLSSPRYGEHQSVAWLDAARYADTSGYQNDGPRVMWRWRDWVIDALNAGMPFDQFTIEQLAGDLLPDPSLEQMIATGFHRNHRGNSEGGIVPEEFAVEYVVDRVDTTGTVWLGLAIGCARCHSHKFDPITQEEYYRLFAFFNNVPENGRAIKEGNSPPFLRSPTRDQQNQFEQLTAALDRARQEFVVQSRRLMTQKQRWEQLVLAEDSDRDWAPREGLIRHWPLRSGLEKSAPTAASTSSESPAETVLVPDGLTPVFEPDDEGGIVLSGEGYLNAGDLGRFTYFDAFSVSAWIRPTDSLTGGIASRMSDDSYSDGWAFLLEDGQLHARFVRRFLDDALRVRTASKLKPGIWQHVVMIYDGSRVASGVKIYVNGQLQPQVVLLDGLNQSFENDEPLRIGSVGTQHQWQGALRDVRLYERPLKEDECRILATAESLRRIAALDAEQRSAGQRLKMKAAFLQATGDPALKRIQMRINELSQRLAALERAIPSTMVMLEMPEPRTTYVLQRGAYDRPGRPVKPGLPAALIADKQPVGGDRLALARWLVDPANPLTARVTVNREWQRFFGTGLVRTSEDFGTQGEHPSHPELLDWLALELVHREWDLKAIQRLIVTSATYRQTSAATPELIEADPDNRLLARGPRFRLSAEAIRDQALAASGLLHERIGGASVFPYQPDGLWKEIASTTSYETSQGLDLFRRSVYSYVKRTVSNPSMALFDAPSREACVVRRSRTNTPLQALTLLNEVTFVEAARKLAEQSLSQYGESDDQRLEFMFRRVLARRPTIAEIERLRESLGAYRQRFADQPELATRLIHIGESTVLTNDSPTELAAHTAIASVLLNLHETVTRH